MAQITLTESQAATLDGSGNGTIQAGPTGPNEVWMPTSVSVICSSNTNEATCKLYVGPAAKPQYFKDITVDGSTGDATDRCNLPIRKGSYVWAVFSGGDAGATAYLNIDGNKVA